MTYVLLWRGMRGVISLLDGSAVDVEAYVPRDRSAPASFPLLNVASLVIAYEGHDIHLRFMRPGEILEEQVLDLPPVLAALDLPSPLAAIENAQTTLLRRLRVTVDNGISHQVLTLGVNEPLQVGPNTPILVPGLGPKTDIIVQREGAPPAIQFQDREGWAVAVSFTKDSDAYLDLSQLMQIKGCVTPPVGGSYEISLANAVEAALRIGDYIFYITYA